MRAVMEHANRCRSICGSQPLSQLAEDLHSSLGDQDNNRFPQPYPIPPLARTRVPSRRSAPHESCKFVRADGPGYEQTDYAVRLDSVPFGLPCGEVRNGSTPRTRSSDCKAYSDHRGPPATNSIRLNEEGETANTGHATFASRIGLEPTITKPTDAILRRDPRVVRYRATGFNG